MTTATTEAGKAYGTSCEKYQELSDKKLANSDTLVVCGYGSCIKVDRGALLIKQGFSHEALKCWYKEASLSR